MEICSRLRRYLLCPQPGQRRKALFWAAVCALIWLFCHYLAGIPFGWQRSGSSGAVLLPTMMLCLLREALRSGLAAALEKTFLKRTGAFFVTCLLLVPVMDLPGTASVGSNVSTWMLLTALPALCTSAMLTMLALHGGMIPGGIYALATTVLPLLISWRPNMPLRLEGMMHLLLPMVFFIALDWEFTPEDMGRRHREAAPGWRWCRRLLGGGLAVLAGGCLCFFAGLLPWRPVSVATGSMEPAIAVGDMVVVSTLDHTPQAGDVIQFQRDGSYVIHRVAAVHTVNGETVYTTRGDANGAEDAGYVSGDMLIGTVKCVVPWLGKLTLWLHSGGN